MDSGKTTKNMKIISLSPCWKSDLTMIDECFHSLTFAIAFSYFPAPLSPFSVSVFIDNCVGLSLPLSACQTLSAIVWGETRRRKTFMEALRHKLSAAVAA